MKIAIYHTTDIHGYIFPTNYVDYKELGLLKILSFVNEDRKRYDDSILLDGGDLIQGSPMTQFLSKHLSDKNPILELTEKANYNNYIMGNHEFNYGLDYLYDSYKLVSDKILNANIDGLNFDSKPYNIFEFDDMNIAVIGLTTSFIPKWEKEEIIKDLRFDNPVQVYKKYEEEMKEKADMIVVLYHGGFEKSLDGKFIPTEKLNGENQASELLETFDSIDILLTGHQHRSFITKIGDVICSQPINNAQNFTKLVIDTKTKEIDYKLIEVKDLNQDINRSYEKIFNDINVELKEYLDQIIGSLDESIRIKDHFDVRLNSHPYINLLHKIQLDVSNADFSATSLFDSAIGFDKEVSIRDILVNYPYPNNLKVLEIKGSDLRHAIEISASYFVVDDNGDIAVNPKYIYPKVRNYIYDFYYGLDYEIDVSRDFGDRVVKFEKDGKEIDLDKTYTIVLNNYRASNVNEYPCYEDKKIVDEISFDMSELMIQYFNENRVIGIDKSKNFNIHK